VNLNSIKDSVKEITTKFNSVSKLEDLLPLIEEAAEENEETDGTRVFLAEIIQESNKEIANIDQKLKLIEEKFLQLVAYFGEVKEFTLEIFFDIMMKFNKDILVNKYLI